METRELIDLQSNSTSMSVAQTQVINVDHSSLVNTNNRMDTSAIGCKDGRLVRKNKKRIRLGGFQKVDSIDGIFKTQTLQKEALK